MKSQKQGCEIKGQGWMVLKVFSSILTTFIAPTEQKTLNSTMPPPQCLTFRMVYSGWFVVLVLVTSTKARFAKYIISSCPDLVRSLWIWNCAILCTDDELSSTLWDLEEIQLMNWVIIEGKHFILCLFLCNGIRINRLYICKSNESHYFFYSYLK